MNETAMYTVTLPKLTDRMTWGTLLRWLINEGEPISRGDLVAEFQTDKANMQVECPVAGKFKRQLARVGNRYPIGAALAQVETTREEIDALPAKARESSQTAPDPPAEDTTTPPEAQEVRSGEVTTESHPPVDEHEDEVITLNQEDLCYAEELTEAWRNIPQATLSCRISLEKALRVVQDYNAGFRKRERKLSPERAVLAAVVRALEKFPLLNSHFDGQRILRKGTVNLGFRVEVQHREVTAVLRAAQFLALPELLGAVRQLERRVRDGEHRSDEAHGESIMVHLLPPDAVGRFAVPLLPPVVACLNIGGIRQDQSQLLTLTVDARVVSLQYASEFLVRVRRLMDNPITLFFPREN